MKTALFLFALCFVATGAFGQNAIGAGAMSNQPQIVEFPDHPQHASQRPLAHEESVLVPSGIVSAQGERPLWEVAPTVKVVPLGDVARMFKKEHESAKKAEIVWEN